jgi:hypothetical protein
MLAESAIIHVAQPPAGDAVLERIGRIRHRGRQVSAVLVSPCHALSVRHLFGAREQPGGKRVAFVAAGGQASGGTVVAAGNYREADGNDRRKDWSIVRLDVCLGRTLGFFDLADPAPSQSLAPPLLHLAGYRGRSQRLTVSRSCRIRMRYQFVWAHDCATFAGTSGGPLLAAVYANGRYDFRFYALNMAGRLVDPAKWTGANTNLAVSTQSIWSQVRPILEPHLPRLASR